MVARGSDVPDCRRLVAMRRLRARAEVNDLIDGPVTVHVGDVLTVLREMSAESVHCVVTSPPYWGLRDYGTAEWEGGDTGCDHLQNNWGVPGSSTLNAKPTDPAAQAKRTPYKDLCGKCGAHRIDSQLGLESTPEEYIAAMVEVFREVRRVLRPDGTLWLNMGDSYATGSSGDRRLSDPSSPHWSTTGLEVRARARPPVASLKPKDLVGIPWRLAFALQADGWWLRSDIIWAKPNPMPESVNDRPPKAHEYIFLLTKSPRYFYDAEAVREPASESSERRAGIVHNEPPSRALQPTSHAARGTTLDRGDYYNPAGRNLRSVWTIATQPYPEAHFATFPEELARRCIAAATSEHGCCPECGAPWARVTATEYVKSPVHGHGSVVGRHYATGQNNFDGAGMPRINKQVTTTGWLQPCFSLKQGNRSCIENRDPIPCTVLDPFVGSGTTLAVARRLGRRAVGIELQAAYLPLIQQRVSEAALPLLEAIDLVR